MYENKLELQEVGGDKKDRINVKLLQSIQLVPALELKTWSHSKILAVQNLVWTPYKKQKVPANITFHNQFSVANDTHLQCSSFSNEVYQNRQKQTMWTPK